MRQRFEALELELLSPLAVKAAKSRGRQYHEPPSENRTYFQRDRDRIVHAKAFRRLKQKTQVFVSASDHYRSRLTHTLEVAQVSRHLARLLRLNEDLCECIALAHDLGHTPFGHSGERELNRLMADYGGFEHNLQSRRIVDILENKYPGFPGLNLSFEVREGLIKHRSSESLETTPSDQKEVELPFISLEAQVCNLADEIAYNSHDLDDGLSSGLISPSELETNVTLWREARGAVSSQYQALSDHELYHLIHSFLISSFIDDVLVTTAKTIADSGVVSLDTLQLEKRALVRYSPEMSRKNRELRQFLFKRFYQHHSIYRANIKGQRIIRGLFEAFLEDPKLLPESYQRKLGKSEPTARVVADYVAGMTDDYALQEYHTIYT